MATPAEIIRIEIHHTSLTKSTAQPLLEDAEVSENIWSTVWGCEHGRGGAAQDH